MDDASVTVVEPQPAVAEVSETVERQLQLLRRQLLGVTLALFALFLLLAGAGLAASGVLAVIALFVTLSGS